MISLDQHKTLKVYFLMRQEGLQLGITNASESGPLSSSLGFFLSRDIAEMNRTAAYLSLPAGSRAQFHVFPLTIPNPAYKD